MSEARIETHESTMQKAAAAFGLDEPSVFETVDRSKYEDDEAYLDALVAEKMKRDNPEYRAARRRLSAEYLARQEQAEKKLRDAQYREIRAGVRLDSYEVQQVDKEAAEMARRDLAAGKIAASGLGAAIERYAKELTGKRLDSKAANQLFNDMLRGRR